MVAIETIVVVSMNTNGVPVSERINAIISRTMKIVS